MMNQKAYRVYRKGRLIDVVFFTNCDAGYIKNSLINHDGYPGDIEVVERPHKLDVERW
jgi:hypothetical protein